MRLFCFHHAGGSAAAFRLWPRQLPEFDVCAVQLPGRANRFVEAPMTDVRLVVDALVDELLPLFDRPYVLFGHSMGTAVAWALAHRLQAMGAPLPQRLFVSGRQPPHRPFGEWSMSGLSDADAVEALHRSFGGLPAEVLANPELIELMLPILRADFELLERYRPVLGTPLPLRVVAMGGDDDPFATDDRLGAWQACTTHPLQVRRLPGDHFYLDAHLDDVLAVLRTECDTAAAESAA